jgi:hypothetical protein
MNTKNEQPFFARFLEGQDFPSVKTNIKAGPLGNPVTHKYPSDSDELELPGPPEPNYPQP